MLKYLKKKNYRVTTKQSKQPLFFIAVIHMYTLSGLGTVFVLHIRYTSRGYIERYALLSIYGTSNFNRLNDNLRW